MRRRGGEPIYIFGIITCALQFVTLINFWDLVSFRKKYTFRVRSYLLPYLPPSAEAWSVLVVLVILGTRTETRMDFDMGEELLSLIYLVLLYYVLVVLVVLVKSKVLRKFSKLFLWYTFGIYIWYMPGYAYKKKVKKATNLNFF